MFNRNIRRKVVGFNKPVVQCAVLAPSVSVFSDTPKSLLKFHQVVDHSTFRIPTADFFQSSTIFK